MHPSTCSTHAFARFLNAKSGHGELLTMFYDYAHDTCTARLMDG